MINPQDVQYYSSLTQELKHTQVHKALQFLVHECITYDKDNKRFNCLPLEGYNKTKYLLGRSKLYDWGFTCTCQFFVMGVKRLDPRPCSHILALHYYFDRRNKLAGWGKYKQGVLDNGK